jgi:ribose 5-phosphate isomerase B
MKHAKNRKPTVIIGADHAGFKAKDAIIGSLAKKGYVIVDVGGFSPNTPDDYPDYAVQVAKAVASDKTGNTRGVLICGSGTGMAIAANKTKGVRAAVIYDAYSAKMARHDNDANIAALRGRNFSVQKDVKLVHLFLETAFSGLQRHKRRIRKVGALEGA